jgi:coproporphyrinogen III oxidase
MDKQEISRYFKGLQDQICTALAKADGANKNFETDLWQRQEGGGGCTRTFTNGAVLEKGGVAFSEVFGTLHPNMAASLGVADGASFFATGVSIVLHPLNPMVPIIHMNVRYFELDNGLYWFGGGIDLSPHYVNDNDAQWFHGQLKTICDTYDANFYNKFKTWADDYFYLPHRNETRGIGGIFFDQLNEKSTSFNKQQLFSFVKAVGEAFAPIYAYFMKNHKDDSYTDAHKNWQYIRRGRYVEFNLLHDRGTKFGLESHGRTESILLSMPPQAQWQYMHQPALGTAEYLTLAKLVKGTNWLSTT